MDQAGHAGPGNGDSGAMTVAQAAELLGVSSARVRQMVAGDPAKGVRPELVGWKPGSEKGKGGGWRISRESVELARSRRMPARQVAGRWEGRLPATGQGEELYWREHARVLEEELRAVTAREAALAAELREVRAQFSMVVPLLSNASAGLKGVADAVAEQQFQADFRAGASE